MLRSLLLRQPKSYFEHPEEEVLFPDIAKQVCRECSLQPPCFHFSLTIQNNRETLNSRELFESVPLVQISGEGELRWELQCLQSYANDRLRFVSRVEVSEVKQEEERNEILIVREPVFSRDDVITFLLVLKWFPNAMKTHKPQRKGSIATDKDLKFRQKKMEIVELLQLVFLLSEKLYLPERYVDEFLQCVSERNQAGALRQANCLTVVLPANKHNYLSTHFTSSQSQSQTQYQEYFYDNNASNRYDPNDRSSIRSVTSTPRHLTLLKRPSGKNNENNTPRNTERKSEGEGKKRTVGCNLEKAKILFSTVEYLITEGELGVETVMCHLNDDRNSINQGYCLQAVQQMLQEWPRHSQFPSLAQLNRQLIMQAQMQHSLNNYRLLATLQLAQLTNISLEAIYIVVRQLNTKAMAEFLATTSQFLHDPAYNESIAHLEGELCSMEGELISNYALGKYEQGQRLLRGLQRRKGKKGTAEGCLLMRLIGREEVGTLDIGFKMYRQLIEGRLQEGFREFGLGGQLRGRVSYTGNNDEDMLANIEGRIQICEQRRRMLESAINLSEKQGQSLRLMIRSLQHSIPDIRSVSNETQQ